MNPHRHLPSYAAVMSAIVAVGFSACEARTEAPSPPSSPTATTEVTRRERPRLQRVSSLRLTGSGDSVDLDAFVGLLDVHPHLKVGYVARLRPPPEFERYAWSVRDPDLIDIKEGNAVAKVSNGYTVTSARDSKGELVSEIWLMIGPLSEREVLVEFDQIINFPELLQEGPDLGTLGGNRRGLGSKWRVELSAEVEVSVGSLLLSRDGTLPRLEVDRLERRGSIVVVSGPEVLPPAPLPLRPSERL